MTYLPQYGDPFFLAIVLALLAASAVEMLVDALEARSVSSQIPPEFQDVYDASEYARSQEYTQAKSRLSLIEGVVGCAATLAFLLLGGIAWLDGLAGHIAGQIADGRAAMVIRGLLFMGGLSLGGDLLSTPFSLWHTFVLEERFGFNRATPRTYVMDKLKGFAIAILLGGPLLAAVLWLFIAAGGWGWLLAWGAVVSFMIVMQYLAPTLLLPLFNTFTPLEGGELRERIEDYSRTVGFALEGVYVIDGSRRTSKANAFFTGFGRRKRIALFDNLVERHSTDEVLAVLAHEVGHYKKRHVPLMLVLGIFKTGVLFFLLSLMLKADGLFAAFAVQPTVHVGLVLFALVYSPVSLLTAVPANRLSRLFERQADAYAAETTGRPRFLAQALKRLAAHSLANLTPHPLDVALHYSHPPVLERVRRLEQWKTGVEG